MPKATKAKPKPPPTEPKTVRLTCVCEIVVELPDGTTGEQLLAMLESGEAWFNGPVIRKGKPHSTEATDFAKVEFGSEDHSEWQIDD